MDDPSPFWKTIYRIAQTFAIGSPVFSFHSVCRLAINTPVEVRLGPEFTLFHLAESHYFLVDTMEIAYISRNQKRGSGMKREEDLFISGENAPELPSRYSARARRVCL